MLTPTIRSGLGDAFLATKHAKLLLLADTDRLDAQLTVAQMQVSAWQSSYAAWHASEYSMFARAQGRFQLVLVPRAGHAVHEDAPEATAAALRAFLHRQATPTRVQPAWSAASQAGHKPQTDACHAVK